MSAEVSLVCGVGGVGKTTLAAAIAVGHALAGRHAVVVTIDPARRLADALGVALGPDPIPVPLDAPGRLDALMVDQKHAFDEAITALHPDPDLAARLKENRYYRAISERLAGAPEYMALETLHRLAEDGRWDVIVVDTPPAGDALDVFRAPARLSRVLGRSVLSVLLRPRSRWVEALTRPGAATLALLVGREVVDDIGEFFRLIAGTAPAFAEHARGVAALLASDRAATLLAVDADAPDRADASGFLAELVRQGPRFGGILVNRVVVDPGELGPPPPPPAGVTDAAWSRLVDGLRGATERERRSARAHAAVVERYRREGFAVWAVPRLDDPAGSLPSLIALARALPPSAAPA